MYPPNRTFMQQKVSQTILSEVHIRKTQSGNKLIICNGVDRNVSICHDR